MWPNFGEPDQRPQLGEPVSRAQPHCPAFSNRSRRSARVTELMNRLDHISGLSLGSLTPADVEYFFRTLNTRVPCSVGEVNQPLLRQLQVRLHSLCSSLGDPLDSIETIGQQRTRISSVITERLDGLKRRDWRKRSEGVRLLDILREAIGEISADLHELGSH